MARASLSQALAIAETQLHAGRFAEAEAVCRAILDQLPNESRALHLLGLSAYYGERFEEAVGLLRRAAALEPEQAGYLDHLGLVLNAMRRFTEAEEVLRHAVQLDPKCAGTRVNRAIALQGLNRWSEAEAAFGEALTLEPHNPAVRTNHAGLLIRRDEEDAAEAELRRALDDDPQHVNALYNLAVLVQRQGRMDEAVALYERTLALQPGFAAAHSALLCCHHYRPGVGPDELAHAHELWDRTHARPLKNQWRTPGNSRDPRRPLRLGFVSPDFNAHPVGRFMRRLLRVLDAEEFTSICYFDPLRTDELTEQIREAAHAWRVTAGVSDAALAEQIRTDAVDILFDLAGHTGPRMLALARRPAPIQITWLGYEGTTGLEAMDYLLADGYQIGAQEQRHYRERVLSLPGRYVCYDPPADAPLPGRPPALENGFVTFASFSNPAKINHAVVEVWSLVLERVPGSRLLLKYRGLAQGRTRDRLLSWFGDQGIGPGRVQMEGWSAGRELFERYRDVDISLDTFPFSGSMTVCNSLWMGVPVVTWPGTTFASRHASGHLAAVGLGEWIAADREAYVERAVAAAGDLGRLAAVRDSLRERVARSPLGDWTGMAANLSGVLRRVWQAWCEGRSAQSDEPPRP